MYTFGKSFTVAATLLAGAAVSPYAQAFNLAPSGSFVGSMTQSVATSQAGYSGPPPCQYQRPVSMQIDDGSVVAAYKDWGGNTIHFRGTVDDTGTVLAWHTNGNGTQSAMNGQITPTGFTGHLQRDNWLCIYDMTMQPAPAAPVR
jgi:hypothetical protein